MKFLRLFLLALAVLGLSLSVAWAAGHLPEERGKKLFNDPNFAGGTVSCNSCHPNGEGLEAAGKKSTFNIMGETQNSLEEATNFCIVNANKGTAIAVDSSEMEDMVAYIKSLGEKPAQQRRSPGYGY